MKWAETTTDRLGPITLAVDTEYQGTETLTIQFAARVADEIRVQVYYSPDIPPPPRGCFERSFINRFPERVMVLSPKPISPDQSPACMLADILGLPAADFLSRYEGDLIHSPHRGQDGWHAQPEHRQLPQIDVNLVGHFLTVDLLRAFGRNFLANLLTPADRTPAVALRDGKVIGFAGTASPADVFSDPVVEYVADEDECYELRLNTIDTNAVCGPAKLDDLARSYLGIAKDQSISDDDKPRMKTVFGDPRRTADAYRYAIQDAVITLLIVEKMEKQHQTLYADFGIPADSVPPMHGTPGLRVANLVVQHARYFAATGSARLGSTGSTVPAGLNRIKELARRGSADAISDGRVSRFGQQTGDTHGGLLHSRTPYNFFHRADEQFRDVDLKSCYPAIIRPMMAYLGRPVVFERGHKIWTLFQAVNYLNRHVDSQYAWFVKVSGSISDFPNTLIPSTVDALTSDNYRDRSRDRGVRATSAAMFAQESGLAPRPGR